MEREPDFDGEIHYALRAESLAWHSRRGGAENVCCSIFGSARQVLIPGVILALFVLAGRIPATWMPYWVTLMLYVVAAGGVLAPLVVRQRRQKREDARLAGGFDGLSNQRYRVRAVGTPTRLARLRELMAAEGAEFEPRVVRVGRVFRPGGRDLLVLLTMFGGILAGLWLATRLFRIEGMLLMWFMMYLAIGGTLCVWAFLWPSYLRFVPGRVDILTYPLLGRGAGGTAKVRSVDLRAARVLVMAPGSAAVFEPGNERPLTFEVGPLPGAEELAFERAMLAAAMSRAPTPPLPTGDLVG